MATLKGHTRETYRSFQERYKECIRMFNGRERTLERKIPAAGRRWKVSEPSPVYGENGLCPTDWLQPAPTPET